jgi:IS1 family transposase
VSPPLSVEGVNKSAIARLEGLSWNTVARWLELAATLARRFNAKHLRDHDLVELQLDEMNTFLQSRKQQAWVFASIDVWSRLWPVTLVGSRTSRNTKRLVRSVADISRSGGCPLITTDGFKFYAPTIRHVFGIGCVLAQVIKKIKCNRVVRVGTKLIVGSEWRLADALEESEDSTKLNTAFIERLNLTIRQGCAYLRRRSPCHARKKRTLDDHLELFRCLYNFVPPHSSLRFGKVTRTPAMQAGLARNQLSLRDIFTAWDAVARFAVVRSGAVAYHEPVAGLRCAA